MTDYICAIPPHMTKRQRLDAKWSWFCDVWRRIAWLHANPWRRFEMMWPRIAWAVRRNVESSREGAALGRGC